MQRYNTLPFRSVYLSSGNMESLAMVRYTKLNCGEMMLKN